jgi:hypothetical protein
MFNAATCFTTILIAWTISMFVAVRPRTYRRVHQLLREHIINQPQHPITPLRDLSWHLEYAKAYDAAIVFAQVAALTAGLIVPRLQVPALIFCVCLAGGALAATASLHLRTATIAERTPA